MDGLKGRRMVMVALICAVFAISAIGAGTYNQEPNSAKRYYLDLIFNNYGNDTELLYIIDNEGVAKSIFLPKDWSGGHLGYRSHNVTLDEGRHSIVTFTEADRMIYTYEFILESSGMYLLAQIDCGGKIFFQFEKGPMHID